MTSSRNGILFIVLSLLCLVLFVVDICSGSVTVPFSALFNHTNTPYHAIIFDVRLPKAITALVTGASISLAGLIMQTLFRNPLAEPYILGISSGAGLGVAVFMMATALLPLALTESGWGLILAATTGAILILLLILLASFKVRQAVSLLIIGIMLGQISGSLISIIQYYTDPDSLKLYIVWSFGNLSAVTWMYMKAMLPVIALGIIIVLMIQKSLNGLLLGENYAQSLGISIRKIRVLIVVATTLLAGATTAFTGPIAFIGIAVPHFARRLFYTSNHRITIPATLLCGGALLLLCDIISQLPVPGYTLPINAISALVGAPTVIWIILRKKR
ncbi:MAG: iron ABC transporter permease [Tannerellaceae bacterium]|jgi:iron complex transport system permease protein|nr:iron ABC transporter permease [Tannerellaceae bacterium]